MSKANIWSPPTLTVLFTSAGDARAGGVSAAAIDGGSRSYADDAAS